METTTKPKAKHIGRKISRIRELRGIKQDALAADLGISQQTISRIETSENVEEETLEKVAKALGIEKEAIKNFSEEGVFNYFSNQNFNDNSSNNAGSVHNNYNFNPMDKIVRLYDEKVHLLERLLQSEREKVELLKGQNKR